MNNRIALIVALIVFSAGSLGDSRPEAKPAIFITAVKSGDLSLKGLVIADGRITCNVVPYFGAGTSKGEKLLTRFLTDEVVKEEIKQELKKCKELRIVDTLTEADLVFHICCNYLGMMLPRRMLQRTALPHSLRISAQALVVPARDFQASVEAYPRLIMSALWQDSTLKFDTAKTAKKRGDVRQPSTKRGGKYVSFQLNDPNGVKVVGLARNFIKHLPSVRTRLILAVPPGRMATAERAEEVRPPSVVEGGEGHKVDSFAATDGGHVTLKVESALVVVPVSIMDRNGRYVTGLVKNDFEVFEDGVQQELTDFGTTESPFHAILLLDMSGSARFRVEDIRMAALAFLGQLRPADQVMVLSFADRIRIDSEFTNDREQLVKAVSNTRNTNNATRVYDSVDLAITERLRYVQGRKALILLTDGVDTASRLAQANDTVERVEESGAFVFPIHYDTLAETQAAAAIAIRPSRVQSVILDAGIGRSRIEYEFGVAYLKSLSERSGGFYRDVKDIHDIQNAFATIAEELRHQYWLGYYASTTGVRGSLRQIRVLVNRPGAIVRARQCYRVP